MSDIQKKVLGLPIETIREKKEIPSSLEPYIEGCGNLMDVHDNMTDQYIFSDTFGEAVFKAVTKDFIAFVESCCKEFSVAAMLPQGGGAGVSNEDLNDLAENPWDDEEGKEKKTYVLPDILKEYVSNPAMKYTEDVECCVNDMMCDRCCPICHHNVSDPLKKAMIDKGMMCCKLHHADQVGADPYMIRNIQGDLVGKEREIRHLTQGSISPEQKSTIDDLNSQIRHIFANNAEASLFPKEPFDDIEPVNPNMDSECGGSCGSECGGGCGSSIDKECGSGGCESTSDKVEDTNTINIIEKVSDVFKASRRFGEDIVADFRSEFNIIGGKLKKIEKNYIKTDASFVPFSKLRATSTSISHGSDVKDSGLSMNRKERGSVYSATNKRDKKMGNRTVILTNGNVPWFKYTLSDNGNEKKRHVEFEFSDKSVKYATYYRAVVMSQFKMMSPEVKDWVTQTYNGLKQKGVVDAPGHNGEDSENPDNTKQNQPQPTPQPVDNENQNS